MIKLVAVPPATVETIWPRLDSLFDDACRHTRGVATKESVKARAIAGHCTLWIVADSADTEITAACVTSGMQFPGGLRALFVELLGGKIKYDIFDFRATLERRAQEDGCKALFFLVPRRWAKRLPDYDIANLLMFKEL